MRFLNPSSARGQSRRLGGFGMLLLMFVMTFAWLDWPRGSGPNLIVYGATPQGIMAAVTAARQGERVDLIEPSTGIGGQLTQGWLATLDMSTDAHGNPFAQGLFHEFYKGLRHDNSFDVPQARALLDQLISTSGVRLKLQTRVTAVQVQAGRVMRLDFLGPAGPQSLSARQVIDATDTATLAALAGAPFTLGRSDTGLDRTQMAASLVFRIRGANLPTLSALVRQDHGREDGIRSRSLSGLVGLTSRYRPSDARRFALRGFNAAVQRDGSLLVNALLIYGVDGTSEASVARAMNEGALEAGRVVHYLRAAAPAAFGQASLGGVAPQLYLRETRHLVGQVQLRAEDVLYGQHFRDAVAVNGYPLDGQVYLPGQPPLLLGTPQPYEVPLAALIPLGFRNLLVVSQAASFGSVAAFSARVVPLQMTLGEAAGQASVLAGRLRLDFPSIDRNRLWISLLRGFLRWHHGRINAPKLPVHRSCPDRHQPGASQAEALLRAGLMSSPYFFLGCLYLDEPETTTAFLNDLQHASVSAQGRLPAADAVFTSLKLTTPQGQLLSAGLARTVLVQLGIPVPPTLLSQGSPNRLLKRGEAAVLRWGLLHPVSSP
jgi:hypothetical protein